MNNEMSNEVSILDGCVVEYDYIYIANSLDALNPWKYRHSRMTVYMGEWHWLSKNGFIMMSTCMSWLFV